MNTKIGINRVSRNVVNRNVVGVDDLMKAGNSRVTERLQNRVAGNGINLDEIFPSRTRDVRLVDFDIPVRIREPRIASKRTAQVTKKKCRLAKSGNVLDAGSEIITGLSRHGIDARPFCVHIPKAREKSFIVQGKDFKWVAVSLKSYKEILGMPKREWNTLVKLERADVRHDGIFVAAPLKGNAKERAMKEVKEMCRDAVMKVGAILTMPFHVTAGVADALMKDPVLLVRFTGFSEGDLFIEIGRWD